MKSAWAEQAEMRKTAAAARAFKCSDFISPSGYCSENSFPSDGPTICPLFSPSRKGYSHSAAEVRQQFRRVKPLKEIVVGRRCGAACPSGSSALPLDSRRSWRMALALTLNPEKGRGPHGALRPQHSALNLFTVSGACGHGFLNRRKRGKQRCFLFFWSWIIGLGRLPW